MSKDQSHGTQFASFNIPYHWGLPRHLVPKFIAGSKKKDRIHLGTQSLREFSITKFARSLLYSPWIRLIRSLTLIFRAAITFLSTSSLTMFLFLSLILEARLKEFLLLPKLKERFCASNFAEIFFMSFHNRIDLFNGSLQIERIKWLISCSARVRQWCDYFQQPADTPGLRMHEGR